MARAPSVDNPASAIRMPNRILTLRDMPNSTVHLAVATDIDFWLSRGPRPVCNGLLSAAFCGHLEPMPTTEMPYSVPSGFTFESAERRTLVLSQPEARLY